MLAELGIAIPVGSMKALKITGRAPTASRGSICRPKRPNVLAMLAGQLLRKLDLRLTALQRSGDRARHLATIQVMGSIGAAAIAASVTDPSQF